MSSHCSDSEDKTEESEQAQVDTGMPDEPKVPRRRVTQKRKCKDDKVLYIYVYIFGTIE